MTRTQAECRRQEQARGGPLERDRERLGPFWPRIAANWERALRAGEDLLRFVAGEEGSVSSFRSSSASWCLHHSVTNPGELTLMSRRWGPSAQAWYRPGDRVAPRFSELGERFGIARASVSAYRLYAVPRTGLETSRFGQGPDSDLVLIRVRDNGGGHQDDLVHLAMAVRGRSFVESEELLDDIELEGLDQRYRNVGLRRFREVWLCASRSRREVIGAILATRGPLGLDLRFLENRCDLLLHPFLARRKARATAARLLRAVAPLYQDYEPGEILISVDVESARSLALGGIGVRCLGSLLQAIVCRVTAGELAAHFSGDEPMGVSGRVIPLPRRWAA